MTAGKCFSERFAFVRNTPFPSVFRSGRAHFCGLHAARLRRRENGALV